MPVAETKQLRDQLAQAIGENKRLATKMDDLNAMWMEMSLLQSQTVAERDRANQERDEALAKVEQMAKVIEELAGDKVDRILAYYDNPHTPPSRVSATRRAINEQKKEERKKKNPTGRRGRHKGCSNTAVSRKATKTVRHMPDKCQKCGSTNLESLEPKPKLVTDIPYIPKVETTNHIIHECRCRYCNGVTIPDTDVINGTSLGPNLAKMAIGLWSANSSLQGIADIFSGLFGMAGCAKSTIQHAKDAVADLLEVEAEAIAQDMIAKDDPLHLDESPAKTRDGKTCKTGRAWLATDRDTTLVKVADSRGAAVLHEHFPMFHRPLTADGYQVYAAFEILQRCWAHILRESEHYVLALKKRTGVSQTDCRDAEALHAKLQLIYHQAKKIGFATVEQCKVLIQRVKDVAQEYPEKLANKISAAAPKLFTFLLYPGMEPTNNPAERELRPIVKRCKISGPIGSVDAMRRFGILFTCLLTWRKRKLNLYDMLDRVLLQQA